MKNKSKLFGAIVLGGSLGLLANPAWVQAGDNYRNDHYMSNQSSSMNYSDRNQQFNASDLSNQQIRRVERKLKAEGYDPGKIDGVFDSQTRQALSEFQRENNVPATGRINEQTLDELGLNNFWNQNRYSSNYNNYYNNNYNNEFSRNYNNDVSRSDIRQVQRALDREGYDPGQIDGRMDQQTRQALRHFQRDEGLAVTGQINQRTANRLGVDLQNDNWQSSWHNWESSSNNSNSR